MRKFSSFCNYTVENQTNLSTTNINEWIFIFKSNFIEHSFRDCELENFTKIIQNGEEDFANFDSFVRKIGLLSEFINRKHKKFQFFMFESTLGLGVGVLNKSDIAGVRCRCNTEFRS